jgi:acylphosphatase
MPDSVRRRVVYHGRVQGVGFRATTCAIASRFSVTGYVRNLPDGTVELVAEGTENEVEQFLAAVARHFARNVTRADVEPFNRAESFSGFGVRY